MHTAYVDLFTRYIARKIENQRSKLPEQDMKERGDSITEYPIGTATNYRVVP
jgi:hypothetical protein